MKQENDNKVVIVDTGYLSAFLLSVQPLEDGMCSS